MSDFLRVAIAFFAVVNPAGVVLAAATPRFPNDGARRAAVAIGALLAGALLIIAALAADRILDALEIEPESFRIAAGTVMATTGVYVTLRPGTLLPSSPAGRSAAIFPIGIPSFLSPAALVAAISYGTDEGTGTAIIAGLLVLALAAAAAILIPRERGRVATDAIARLTGALLVVLAVALVVDGVLAV